MSAPNDQGVNTVTWRPHVTQVGNLPRPTSQLVEPNLVTNTSLKHNQPPYKPIGSSHNTLAKPFGSYALVHKQYNSPINLFSNKNIAETINAHSEILAPGVVGINFMKQDAPVNKESDVYKAILEEEAAKNQKKGTGAQFGKQYGLPTNSNQVNVQTTSNELNPPSRFEELPRTSPTLQSQSFKRLQHILGDDATTPTTRHVEAPTAKPNVAPNQTIESNICSECGRLIVGIFCKIKDRKLHEECFKCSTCGTSLKNQGYFNINEKLYCEIHIQQAAQASHSPTRIITPNCTTVRSKESVSKPTSPAFQMNKPNFSSQQSAGSSKPNSPAINLPWTENQTLDSKLNQQQQSSQLNYSNTASTLKTSLNKNLYQSVPHPYPGPGKDTFKPSSTTISAPKFSWPSKTMVESSETVKTVYSSSSGDTVSNTYSSNYSNSFNDYQQNSNLNNFEKMKINDTVTSKKIPPNTLPKPNLGPNWQSHSLNKATNTTQYKQSLTSSGQSSFTGSRPAPRRGRGQLKSLELGARVPVCANTSCCQQIRGPFISALGKTWCPEHFVCAHSSCRRSLQDCGFVEEKGILYCESCFEIHFAPSCANCHQRIKGDCLIALDKQYHPECFVCSYCKKVFANTSFYLEDGLPYCEKDWNELFTTKCIACNLPIAAGDRWVEALNNNYHSQCFKCTLCGVNLEGQSFYARNGQAFCKLHASRPN